MSLPGSLQLRLVLLAIVAALGLAAFTLTRIAGGEEASAPPAQEPAPRAERPTRPAASAPRVTLQPARRLIPANGLPLALATELAANPVVVVSLFAPGTPVDSIATAEARAGAAAAGAGFVALNVRNDAETRPLVLELGVLENPAVLVLKRPKDVLLRIDGYADRETVAQAAENAASTKRPDAR